tara:strand:- start:511 stop:723 length:213 start_codon:yes stop_codon:yes gene_type:complete
MKSKAKVIQDYSRNAIADFKAGDKKEGNYEKKKALEMGAGEGPSMYGSPAKMNNSPMQMKGSWMSKHCSK